MARDWKCVGIYPVGAAMNLRLNLWKTVRVRNKASRCRLMCAICQRPRYMTTNTLDIRDKISMYVSIQIILDEAQFMSCSTLYILYYVH